MIEDKAITEKIIEKADKAIGPPDYNFYPNLVTPGGVPVGVTPIVKPELEPVPTWGETLEANFRQYNTIYRAAKGLSQYKNPFLQAVEREEGYNPVEENILDDVPEEYHMRILLEANREDALAVKDNINQELEDKRTASRSGNIANIVTTLGATLLDPTLLIPFSQTVKYASVSKGVYANMINTAATMGPAIALQNAVLVGTKETEGLQEWAYNTMFESFVAAGIGGVLGAFAAKGVKSELNNAKAFFKAAEKDVDIKYKLNEKGEYIGAQAVPLEGSSVGAAEVENIQAMLDSGQVSFKNNKFVKTAFGWGSPIIKGVTNRFETVRNLTTDLFPNVFEVAGGVAKAIKGPAAYSYLKLWRATNEHAGIFMHAQWLDYLGIKGPGKSARGEIGSWTGKWMSREEFSELVAKAHRRGGESDIPQVAQAAKLYEKEVYKPLFEELQKRYPTLQAHEFSNISSYLNRVYDKDKIMAKPDLFMQDVEKYIAGNNDSIIGLSAPIEQATQNVNYTREQLKNIKKTKGMTTEEWEALKLKREDLKTLLAGEKAQLDTLEKELQTKIADGQIPLDLLEGKPNLTSAQIEEINKLNAPVVKAEEQLKAAREELQKLGTLKNLKDFLTKELTGTESAAISDVAAAVERFGIDKTLAAVKKYRSSIVAAEKKVTEESSKLRAKIKEQNDLIKELKEQKADKKAYIKALEEKLAQVPSKDKKQARMFKTEIANEKKNLDSIPALIEEARERIKPLHEEIAGIKDAREYIEISKETAGEALPFIEKIIKNFSAKELDQQIATIEKAISKINREGLKIGKVQRNQVRRKIKQAKEDIKAAKEKITKGIESGTIPEDLFYYGARGAYLHDPNALPKLRQVLTPEQIRSVAEGVRNNITQLNEEQVLGEIFNSVTSGGNNPLKTRTLLWNDEIAEPWLVNRMDTLSGLYTDQIARRVYWDDVARQYGSDSKEGVQGIVRNLLEERGALEAEILKKADTPERAKELAKLDKDFRDATKFMEDMYKVYMGNYVDKTTAAYRISDGVKKFGVATLLGNLPILQLTEFFSPLFRFTFSEYIYDGLVPALKKMRQLGDEYRGAYADMGLGVNRYIGNRTQALAGYGAQYSPRTVAERYVDNLAKWSQNFSLANYIMDAQEVMVGGMSESSLIRTLKKYTSGEQLTKREIDMLDRARFNPLEFGDRALKQYEKYGQDIEGAFNPNFHLWDDQAAARQFRISIEAMTREVLIKPGPLDMPLAFKDPMLSLVTQFTSYVFAATNNFTIPLLTSGDKQKFFGMVMMMTAGSLVGPLRSLAKGEELDLSFGVLANEAMTNSGVLGWQYDGLMRLNSALDLEPLRFLQSSRMRSKALTLGPASGLYGMATSFLSAAANGEMNQADLKRGMKLATGFGYNWFTRRPIDYVLESYDLPKNRQEAKRLREQGE